MQRFILQPHPDRPPGGVETLAVEVERDGDVLSLTYRVSGADHVRWPDPAPPARADELWRTTCFEMFLMFDDQERYVEFNFSPSTRWAAYAFDGYREGAAVLEMAAPAVERRPDGVRVRCDVSGLPHGALAMGLSAVIEEGDGTTSYWALAHPPGAPDFHHAACFAAVLPSPADA